MKHLFLISIASFFFINAILAQNNERLSPEFKAYLTDRGLLEKREKAISKYSCPKQKIENKGSNFSVTNIPDPEIRRVIMEDETTPLIRNSAWIAECVSNKAEHYKQQLKKDPEWFHRRKKVVLDVLMRFPEEIKNVPKIMVTDITSSMDEYMEQILLWHSMDLGYKGPKKYVFFNDGDETPDKSKKIGETGGIYTCEGNIGDLTPIIAKMQEGMKAGLGGDMPENDVEALLEAVRMHEGAAEIILIADNNSSVRDIKLSEKLAELKIPIRIIICGLEYFTGKYIHEDYVDLAYKTKGSIHTIRADFWDLSTYVEGNKDDKKDGKLNYKSQDDK